MCNDIELFINLIYMTSTMKKLQDYDIKQYLNCIKETQDWDNFKSILDIINLNNININRAIKEIINDDRFVKTITSETDINLKEINEELEKKNKI